MDNSLNCLICFGPFSPDEVPDNPPIDSQNSAAWDGKLVDRLSDKEVTKLSPCGHKYHYGCIRKWASASITCPADRSPIIRSFPKIPTPENLTEQLNKAAFNGNLELVNFLLTLRTDINAVNSEQESPLLSAVQNQHLDVAEVLIDHGAQCTDAHLELELAELYEDKQNFKKAFEYYQLSAQHGYAEGYNNLGRMHEIALGVEQNLEEAFRFYQTSATLENVGGMNNLARMYELALGVDQNLEEAFRYHQLSAQLGDEEGLNNLGRAYELALGTDENLPEALKCYQEAVYLGSTDGMNNLGRMYEDAIGVEVNLELAFHYYKSSAELGDPQGQNCLGHMYEFGFGTTHDLNKAFKYYKLSADQGHIDGEESLQHIRDVYDRSEFAASDDTES